ncbi:hypothetical protein PIB30_080726, partial [Stylosanthes scabra]|nr:hypothetical protein [Stylosanthes scabra]
RGWPAGEDDIVETRLRRLEKMTRRVTKRPRLQGDELWVVGMEYETMRVSKTERIGI